MIASNLALWLVLLASVRGMGLSQSQVPWETSLAAFAFVRLVTVLPITPGGAGITELGLVGILSAGAGHRVAGQVTAAVLLYRAVTYLVPIPAGAIACVAWRYAPSRIHRRKGAATLAAVGAGPVQQAMGECMGHVSAGGVPACRLRSGEDGVEAGAESLVVVVGPDVLAEGSQDRERAGWQ
jgi:Lysylphosphatidylglycerol synthase TM region